MIILECRIFMFSKLFVRVLFPYRIIPPLHELGLGPVDLIIRHSPVARPRNNVDGVRLLLLLGLCNRVRDVNRQCLLAKRGFFLGGALLFLHSLVLLLFLLLRGGGILGRDCCLRECRILDLFAEGSMIILECRIFMFSKLFVRVLFPYRIIPPLHKLGLGPVDLIIRHSPVARPRDNVDGVRLLLLLGLRNRVRDVNCQCLLAKRGFFLGGTLLFLHSLVLLLFLLLRRGGVLGRDCRLRECRILDLFTELGMIILECRIFMLSKLFVRVWFPHWIIPVLRELQLRHIPKEFIVMSACGLVCLDEAHGGAHGDNDDTHEGVLHVFTTTKRRERLLGSPH